jgi:hypothetical protein
MTTTAVREVNWRKYKSDFLRANRCTEQEFHDAFVEFMETEPDTKAFRQFARKYHITIHPEPRLPEHLQVVLSVNIAAVKVMAQSEREAYHAIADIVAEGRTPND